MGFTSTQTNPNHHLGWCGECENTPRIDRYGRIETQDELLLAAAVRRLRSADDLTLHVTCGDITHSCERKTEHGLRAHCLPRVTELRQIQDLTDLATRH